MNLCHELPGRQFSHVESQSLIAGIAGRRQWRGVRSGPMPVLLLSLLWILATAATANDWDGENDSLSVSVLTRQGWVFSEPVTVEEIESRSLAELRKTNGHAPMVPFGGRNAAWEDFKAHVQPGDQIVYFRSPQDTWEGLYGRAGYALVREGVVVHAILTLVN